MTSLRKSNVMKAVKASNYMKTRAKWGHSINTILKEKNPNELPFQTTDISKYLKQPEDDGEDDVHHNPFQIKMREKTNALAHKKEQQSKRLQKTRQAAPSDRESKSSNNIKKSLAASQATHAAMMIEFQPGTNVVYGSYINFKSSQGWYLHINQKNGLGTCVESLKDATTFKIMNEDGDKNFGPVSFGDCVRLIIQDQEYTSELGDVFEFVLGSKMAIDLNNVSRTKMDQATPHVLPSRVPYFGKKKGAKARWTLVHPTKGYTKKCKGVALTHLGDVSLETDWLRLTSVGRAEYGNVSVALHEPYGSSERQEVKLKTNAGKLRKEKLKKTNNNSNGSNSSNKNHKVKKTVSGLTAAANMRWNVHLAMLATSKDGGETTAENKANERTLLRAQEQVFASRKRREMRGDNFVMKINSNMKVTYAKAENEIATIKLKDRLYKDISNASLFSEQLSTQPKRRDSKAMLTEEEDATSEQSSIQHETTLNTHPFPIRTLTTLEKANAIAEAARLQALVKSSVWAEISAQQRLQEKEEAEELKRAVIVLQRATRNWIRKRWKVRLERQDVDIFSVLDAENNNNNNNTFITSVGGDGANGTRHNADHLRTIGAYKQSRPSSAASAPYHYNERKADYNRNNSRYPSSATPQRTLITHDTNDYDEEDKRYTDDQRTLYGNRSMPTTSFKHIKQRRRQRPQTANARVVPRRSAFGSSNSYNAELTSNHKLRRAQSAKRVAHTNEKVMATIESVKKLQDKLGSTQQNIQRSNTPLNDALDEAILQDDAIEKKLLLQRGYAMPRTLINNAYTKKHIRPKSAIGSPLLMSSLGNSYNTRRPVSAAAGLFHHDSNHGHKHRNAKRTPLRRSKSAGRYVRPKSGKPKSKRGKSAKLSKYLRNMHILPVDYPPRGMLRKKQNKKSNNKKMIRSSISGPNLQVGLSTTTSSSSRMFKSNSEMHLKSRFSLKGLKMTEQDKTLAHTVKFMEHVSDEASSRSNRKWNY